MSEKKTLLRFKGEFNTLIIEDLLKKTRTIMEELKLETIIYKRLFSVIEEILGNISRHSIKTNKSLWKLNNHSSFFNFETDNDKFIITCGNLIANNSIEDLKNRINMINELSLADLKELYKDKVLKADISEKGGAGLGLITIAKAAMNKFTYDFKTISNETTFFTISIIISKY